MTDYGAILDRYEEEREEEARKAAAKARELERKRVDESFEDNVLRAKCSANSDLVKFATHMRAVQKALKAAADDGFCLDEIMDGLKELEK